MATKYNPELMLLDFTYDKSDRWYQKEWLPKLKLKIIQPWQESVYRFLVEWFSGKEYFEIKTSGTTGPPKIERFPRKAFIASARITIKTFDLKKEDCLLMCLPVNFVAGKMMLIRAIVGHTKLLALKPTINPIKDLKISVSFAAFTPHQLQAVLAENPDTLDRVKIAIIGGSPLSDDLKNKVSNLRTQFFETFGMSETLSHIAIKKINGFGATEHFNVLDGFKVSCDNRSRLIIAANHLDKSPLYTNDVVALLTPVSFNWLGRADQVINSGGIKMFPEIIEKKMIGLLKRDFFIGKQNDDGLGEVVILNIEGEAFNKTMLEELKINLAKKLNKFELPKKIIFKSNFIRNENGKIVSAKNQ